MMSRYLEKLIKGDRIGCRQVLGESLQTGTPVNVIYTDLFWPAMAQIEQMYREHQIDLITEHMATRINRTLVDQLQSKLPHNRSRGLRMILACAGDEPEELGAQMCADLFESDGWEVRFLGGGVPNDEIMQMIAAYQPDIVFLYGTKPSGAPQVRQLMDTVREIGACPKVRFMLSGGVFNRAEGLWEEIGADLFAPTAKEALLVALSEQRAEPDKRKNRRKTLRAKNIEIDVAAAPA
ncbi:MAG: cobalamin-dependent protein [Sedimentisphaerales bacterium]|nr:cobalamin-dependent protein [Sedimentisphaerales bacterium]